jgi:acylphosphatase
VGFRWFVRDQARRLGVRGTVRNRDDGSVEVHASGAETTISKLRALLYDGPPGAVVERVEEITPPTALLPESFSILR